MSILRRFSFCGAAVSALLLCGSSIAHGYIGPGAGFAFLSSFIFILGGFLLAFLALLAFPFRWLAGRIRSRKARARAKVNRLIIIGLDGMDPELAKTYMGEGKLTNLDRLRREGYFSPLHTSNPPISPVAWSTFMTGVNPGKHAIFDFLRRDAKSYLPGLSSADISTSSRSLRLGKLKIPIGKPTIRMLRKSVPFWTVLGDSGVPSVILKVPITFPPEKFRGLLLSGLCAPDIKGSQGTFAFYTNRERFEASFTGGYLVILEGPGPIFDTRVSGPKNPFREEDELRIPMRITVDVAGKAARLRVGEERICLKEGMLSEWVPLTFCAPLGVKIRGIAQFFLKRTSPHVELYLSPIHIDPEKPSLPLSHPVAYSVYLAKVLGPYATLGLPQDTWALNEKVLTDEAFLEQTYRIHDRLEEIFFHSMRQVKRGFLCCVFDTTDVIQHEFWRYLEDGHPALRGCEGRKPLVIEELYTRMDGLVGRVRERLRPGDALVIMSDHGFKLFSRCVNLNTWLCRNGYLALKDGAATCGDWFAGVDWGKTRAYALGLSCLYLNLRGRESGGIVEPEEAAALRVELIRKLTGLRDDEKKAAAISAVYDSREIYQGPYTAEGPDLIVGYHPGYRAAWESVTGRVTSEVFSDNEKAWSADHCIDHRFVPGVLFCDRKIAASEPHLQDIAPTVLDLFGIEPPSYMDGKVLQLKV